MDEERKKHLQLLADICMGIAIDSCQLHSVGRLGAEAYANTVSRLAATLLEHELRREEAASRPPKRFDNEYIEAAHKV